MPRIRTIKPEFWTSAPILNLNPLTRLFFVGMWNFCDDEGRHLLDPKLLKARIFPSDDIDYHTITGMVSELYRNALIVPYRVGNVWYFYITGWEDNQRIQKRAKSNLPDPKKCEILGAYPTTGTLPEWYDNVTIPFSLERKGKERKGEEDLSCTSSLRSEVHSSVPRSKPTSVSGKSKYNYSDTFETFWSKYPRKVAKPRAFEMWSRALGRGVTAEQMTKGADFYARQVVKLGTEAQFVRHPATWINDNGWEDSFVHGLTAPANPETVLRGRVLRWMDGGGWYAEDGDDVQPDDPKASQAVRDAWEKLKRERST